jgi:hypothetical protein
MNKSELPALVSERHGQSLAISLLIGLVVGRYEESGLLTWIYCMLGIAVTMNYHDGRKWAIWGFWLFVASALVYQLIVFAKDGFAA